MQVRGITRRGHISPPKGRKRSGKSNARLGAVLKQFQVDDIQNPPGQQLWHRPGQSWPKISRHGRFEQNQAYFLLVQIFPPRPKISRQAKAANCPARTANQSPAEIPAEAGLDKKYKVEYDWISIFFRVFLYRERVNLRPRKLPKLDLKPMRKEDDLEYKQQRLEVYFY
ncbi:hypothetical protein V6N12_068202 [Hibiscus sabdariffa]|uniref:Uncharacterized protein n=1 Tax=Hibiscus sabdariffa TaxID=183260 RepID=A0ABR2FPI9_9ROSI